jgi:hypothetical protein
MNFQINTFSNPQMKPLPRMGEVGRGRIRDAESYCFQQTFVIPNHSFQQLEELFPQNLK